MTCNHLSQDFSGGFIQGQALQSSAERTWSCFIQVAKDRNPQKVKELGGCLANSAFSISYTSFSCHPSQLWSNKYV